MTAYAELQVTSNFSFLRGAAHPQELVATAAALGHAAVAITDRNSLAGVVRAHVAAKQTAIRLVVGARLDFTDSPSVLCLPTDAGAYARLSRLLTLGKRRAAKGECHLTRADLYDHDAGQILIAAAPDSPDQNFVAWLKDLAGHARGRCYLAASHRYRGDDAARIARLAEIAETTRAPLVATNDVHYHVPERRALQDVLTCIRDHCTIDQAGLRLAANAERHLKTPGEMARLFRDYPRALARSVEIAEACDFSLDSLRYQYPSELAPAGTAPQAHLAALTEDGAHARYGAAVPDKVRAQIAHELTLIGKLDYAPYFLTVHDIVRFAKSRGILCQGRGSAANSAVCYCLGITAVDPNRFDLLFERFISAARDEPPDIDVDFEHERREEVIQYIYAKYGRERCGLTATVISYRSRSAIRDVGKALGLSRDVVGALAGTIWGRSSAGIDAAHARELGLDPDDRRLALALDLSRELIGFPRHLSQHVGGFVITRGPLSEIVPIANAAMADRTVIEWDKDDIDALGILKMDVLGLGMLTCIRKAFDLIAQHHGKAFTLATVPAEDPAVYDMLCQADSVGVFQVESRAQMSMLPRLKPRCFYDLVIEVAIVRPGPIQGDMVHPYLRRRAGEEEVSFPSAELEAVLGKTLGVPLFQEQAMRIAVVAGGFTPDEADALRRAMATFRKSGLIHKFHRKLVDGMVARGYESDFAERCFSQIEGFGEYGFPESHAASFALLVYVSAWLKRHYPAAFAAALLNSQPMGFYAPAQIVRDARDHGVIVRPPDVNHSDWDCALEPCTIDPTRPIPSPCPSPEGEGTLSQQPFHTFPPSPNRQDWRQRVPSPGGEGQGEGGGGSIRTRDALKPIAPTGGGDVALRLGLRQIKGFREAAAEQLVAARGEGYENPREMWRRSGLGAEALDRLAQADAFTSMGLSRRAALWAVKGLGAAPLPLFAAAEARNGTGGTDGADGAEPSVALPEMALGEEVVEDYRGLRLSLKQHPVALLRRDLARRNIVPSARLAHIAPGKTVRVAGLVVCRQRPGTARGVIFVTLEDETGNANVIIWADVFERHRRVVLGARLLGVEGILQREGLVIHVVAKRLSDLSDHLAQLTGAAPLPTPAQRRDILKVKSRNFR